jgi:hypothetical protein
MKKPVLSTLFKRGLQPAEWNWQGHELSTSEISAILVLCSSEGWSPHSYQRCSHAMEWSNPLGCMQWQNLAERYERFQ